jgi:adenylate kinase
MRTYLVFLGPPGAGKGTQAQILAGELGLPQVSTGDLFRAMRTQDTPLARQVQAIMARGDLVPDDLTIQIVKERLAQPDCERGCILDGFPRTVAQAQALDWMLAQDFDSRVSVVPFMQIDEEEAVRRISGRRSCPSCNRIYHVEFDPPREAGRCDNDGEMLIQREDDKADVVRQRYQVYLKNTSPLVEYYRGKGLLTEVDAVQLLDRVTATLKAAVERARQ